ncbi:hypothetical protein SLA2020_228850 [Shorea laevis]
MDYQEAPTIVTIADIHTPQQRSPDFIPVGSSDEILLEILSPSDGYHNHDNEHDQDHDHDQESSSGAGMLTVDLKHKIIKQAR